MEVLLTNDDGIDRTGLVALYEALSDFGDVTAVAPADDQSAVGRSMSTRVEVDEHELGYAIHGTPADCIVVGLGSLVPDADLVVAGCNKGANIGQYVIGRSGTVSAAVEAAFFGVPAMAVSMYVPGGEVDFTSFEPTRDNYAAAVHAAQFLADHAIEAGVFEQCDYLNVNSPMLRDGHDRAPPLPMEVTEPSNVYEMDAERYDGHLTLHDRLYERMDERSIEDPEGTDRRAVFEGRVSVSPLTAPNVTHHHEALDGLATAYD